MRVMETLSHELKLLFADAWKALKNRATYFPNREVEIAAPLKQLWSGRRVPCTDLYSVLNYEAQQELNLQLSNTYTDEAGNVRLVFSPMGRR